jgi:hypothetical protein
MRKTFYPLLGLLGGLMLMLPGSTMGSGSYPGRPPQPPTAVDTAKYHLGKQIFTGAARLGDNGPAAVSQQEARLKALQTALPRAAQASANLPALAGKLSADRLEALEYYLAIRYKIEIK